MEFFKFFKNTKDAKYWVGEAQKISIDREVSMGKNSAPLIKPTIEGMTARLEYYNKALEQDPKYVPALLNKTLTLITLKRKSEAKETVEFFWKLIQIMN